MKKRFWDSWKKKHPPQKKTLQSRIECYLAKQTLAREQHAITINRSWKHGKYTRKWQRTHQTTFKLLLRCFLVIYAISLHFMTVEILRHLVIQGSPLTNENIWDGKKSGKKKWRDLAGEKWKKTQICDTARKWKKKKLYSKPVRHPGGV